MYGTLANNSHVLDLMAQRLLEIKPFNRVNLKTAHYPLTPFSIKTRTDDGRWVRTHTFDDDPRPYLFAPNQYAVVEVREDIQVGKGIIAKFVPTSNLVEQAFGLTAGRLEYPFGRNAEVLVFGIKNQLNMPNPLSKDDFIAYAEFHDLRALQNTEVQLTDRDKKIYAERVDPDRLRRADDDGVYSVLRRNPDED
jgi:hypothetical protein